MSRVLPCSDLHASRLPSNPELSVTWVFFVLTCSLDGYTRAYLTILRHHAWPIYVWHSERRAGSPPEFGSMVYFPIPWLLIAVVTNALCLMRISASVPSLITRINIPHTNFIVIIYKPSYFLRLNSQERPTSRKAHTFHCCYISHELNSPASIFFVSVLANSRYTQKWNCA